MNSIIEIGEKDGHIQILLSAHAEGELWGLDSHPTVPRFITASFDGTVRLWDLSSRVCIHLKRDNQDIYTSEGR